ncbi:MAG TPA: hypothetical protein VGD78_05915 [Chthoniobacterales bacterium]
MGADSGAILSRTAIRLLHEEGGALVICGLQEGLGRVRMHV